jgi:Ser/Thr protein kinase RdoA (MazF antagonist)
MRYAKAMEMPEILQQVLARYDLTNVKARLLQNTGNEVYCLATSSDKRYSLRICPVTFQNPQWLADELTWLDFVAQRNRVTVPRPVPNQQGELLTSIATPTGIRYSCLFDWVEGNPVQQCLTLPVLYNMGRAVATLHQISKEFGFPTSDNPFRNDYRYDRTLILSHRDWIGVHHAEIGVERVALLNAAVEWLLDHMAQIGETPANFGFIHADLHIGNFLAQNDEVSVLDFDQLGRGHYLFDLAQITVELSEEPTLFAERWQSFLKGYESITPLPFDNVREIEPFVVAVHLAFLDWVYNSPNPAVRQGKMAALPACYAAIQQRLEQH